MARHWWHARAERLDWLLLIALPVLLHAPELVGVIRTDPRLFVSGLGVGLSHGLVGGQPGYLDPNSAFTAQDFGHLAAEQWLRGMVPWWNPFVGVGAPLAAEMQPAALFLPFVLLMHFQQGWLWLHVLMQIIAATGAYALLRGLGLSRAAALIGAVLYGGTGAMPWFSHGPERVAAFLPWMLHGVELCRVRLRGGAVFAAALAYSIYAGFPETAYLNGLLALAWAIVRGGQQGWEGWRFGLRLAVGGVAGLLMAMPAIWPFAQYLGLADVGGHHGMAWVGLARPGVAMLLLPYVNGPVAALGERVMAIWGSVGGYVGIGATVLALAGALSRRSEFGLRVVLFGWLVFGVARTAGWGPAAWLSNLIPLVGQTAFYRYIVPSLAMAAAVLAALAVDDWRLAAGRVRGLAAGVAGIALIAGAAVLCRPVLRDLWPVHGYRVFYAGSVFWAVLMCGAIAFLFSRRFNQTALAALSLLIGLDTAGMYLAARLAARRDGQFDVAPVRFLQHHAGLSRVISASFGLGLNESAWDELGSVDDTMLPTPAAWSRFTHANLGSDAISFHPLWDDAALLARNWPVFRALGVGWLVAGRGYGPAHMLATQRSVGPRRALPLAVGEAARGDLVDGLAGVQPIEHVGIDIGTYGGLADGSLLLRLSGNFPAATARAQLAGAADNAPIDFTLDRPVPAGVPVQWRIEQKDSTHPVAIWLFGAVGEPRFSTALAWPGMQPKLVFSSATKEIYRLPDPAPYWDAAGCAVAATTRTDARVTCPRPGSLLRRELFYPGWRAVVNATPAPIRQDGLFQRIDLPAGDTMIRFSYAPPGIVWACLAGAVGFLATLVLALAPGGRRERRKTPGVLGAAPARGTGLA